MDFFYLDKISDNFIDIERGLKPINDERISGVIGWAQYRGSRIRFTIYNSLIVIKAFLHEIILKYSDINNTEIKEDIFGSKNLLIESKDNPVIKIYSDNNDFITKKIKKMKS